MKYIALLRGINVGGKNKVPMAELRDCFEVLGYHSVQTYIASGNVIFESLKSARIITQEIETILPKKFKLDSAIVKVHVLTQDNLQRIVDQAPKAFGAEPDTYHSDVIFLMGVTASQAIKVFNPRDGVDEVTPGDGVVYSQRLSAERTKSRLSAIVASPLYASMTIRNWNTTKKLLALSSD